jgi:hypothetical protein
VAEVIGEINLGLAMVENGTGTSALAVRRAPVLLRVAVGATDEEDLNPLLSDSAGADQP